MAKESGVFYDETSGVECWPEVDGNHAGTVALRLPSMANLPPDKACEFATAIVEAAAMIMTEAELSGFLREGTQQLRGWTAELRGLKPMTWKEPETRTNVAGWVGDTPPPPTAQRDMAILDALHVAWKALGATEEDFRTGAFYDAREKALMKLSNASSLLKTQPFDGLEEGSTSLPF